MKVLKCCCLLFVAGLFCSSAFAATIAGSAHDFSGQGWNASGEICKPCHVPHNAYPYDLGAGVGVPVNGVPPLWNHAMSGQTFTVYTSPTGTLDAGPLGQPQGVSLACLSCHDGVTALDAFGGAAGGTTMTPGINVLGTDLRNDHPISFTYDTALANSDGGLFDPATQVSGLGSTIQNDMLFNDQMECGSCHDVHDPQYGFFLRKSNAASALCLTCHDK